MKVNRLIESHRIMPELPSNMQDQLAHLELEARNPQENRISSQSTTTSSQSPSYQQSSHTRDSSLSSIYPSQTRKGPGFTASYQYTNAAAYQNLHRQSMKYGEPESPKFSPFPKVRDAGPNIPLSDDEKEEVLERTRPEVLKSTDPEMQLAWAQDALAWVEVAAQNYARQQIDSQPQRSMTPKIEHQLRVDALSIVSFLAEQHHPKAEFMKGMWLEFGKFGYRMDKKEAFLAYKRAAERSYPRAEYRIGMQYESSNNSFKAIEHYNKGVSMRDSASNYRLGMMTLLGQHDTPQDYRRGIDLIRFAAETADENAPQGAYVYGMLLARELPNISVPDAFLPYDQNEAKLFIEKAAYLGFAKAQLKMAQAYELCQLGCEFEPALSLHYNALAARQNEPEADMAISKWFLCGYEGIFEKNEELAFTYAKRAAASRMATAEFALGYFYEIGMYVPVDLRESESWYNKAAEHGNKDALGRIDSIKKNNTLSKKDHEQVAISRIKSQYGSQRGNRPDRFKQRGAALPSITDESIDMPDPRASYARPQSSNPPPPRPVSVAPYPEDDIPAGFRSPALGATAAFYNQGGQGGLRAARPQADRPSSAFGIRPVSHGAPADPYSLSSPTEYARPSSSQGNMSNTNGSSRVSSAGWEPQMPQNYRQPPKNQAPILPHIEPTRPLSYGKNPQEQSKLQKPLPNHMNKPQSQAPSHFPGSQDYNNPSQKPLPQTRMDSPATQRRDPAMNQYQKPERGSSRTPVTPAMGPQHQQRPDSRPPQSPISVSSKQSNVSQKPPQQTMSSQGPPQTQRPASQAPSSAGSMAPPGPKKTGPATFEQMGIPAAKQENDCVRYPL